MFMVRSADVFKVPVGRDVVIASLVSNLLALALPIVLLQIYDRVIPNRGVETLTVLAIGLIVAITLDVVLKSARASLMAWAGARFESALAERAVHQLLTGTLSDIEKDPPGTHLDRLNSIDRIRDFRTGEPATAFLDVPFVFLFAVVIALISPVLAAVVLVLCAVALIATRRIEASARELVEARSNIDTRRHSFLIEVLNAIETVKSLGIGEFMERRYERLMGTSAALGARAGELSHLSQGLAGSLSQLTTAAVATVGAVLVIGGSMTVGSLAAAILLAGRIIQPLFKVEAINGKSEELKIWERRLGSLFDGGRERHDGIDPGEIDVISLDKVSFRRRDDEPCILEDVDLEIRRGEIIAISGASGSGKSTLMGLLAGELLPSSGAISVNGHEITACDYRVLRRQISLLPQRHTLLDGTIFENMTRFEPDRNAAKAIEVASMLELDRFFSAHPLGLACTVRSGEAADLPASVADRVALVRGLVNLPRVILFDEANQSLDKGADVALLNYLRAQREEAAVVLVTQRPSYAAIADRRYNLTDGHLVEIDRDTSASSRQERAG